MFFAKAGVILVYFGAVFRTLLGVQEETGRKHL